MRTVSCPLPQAAPHPIGSGFRSNRKSARRAWDRQASCLVSLVFRTLTKPDVSEKLNLPIFVIKKTNELWLRFRSP
ncbi:hypothetical protein [Rhizobium sp. Root1203]|uniref:hypothetical protein n=1 Tax=Rhizobium sp. Root1203 TaxID=1736427 RepID=UPI003FCFC0E5